MLAFLNLKDISEFLIIVFGINMNILNNKLTILNQIKENKDVLFGRFTESLTHSDKISKWKEISETLRALGVYDRDWKYLRETTWQNWRKRTMEKKDNRLQTGSGGGKKFKYDESDQIVLDIIGKNSPAIDGLIVPESSGSSEAQVFVPEASPIAENAPIDIPISPVPVPSNTKKRSVPTRISPSEADLPDELMYLKAQKLKVEIELSKENVEVAKRERHKLDLEILKLERDLEIQPSQFTLPYYYQDLIVAQEKQAENVESVQENDDILQQAVIHIL